MTLNAISVVTRVGRDEVGGYFAKIRTLSPFRGGFVLYKVALSWEGEGRRSAFTNQSVGRTMGSGGVIRWESYICHHTYEYVILVMFVFGCFGLVLVCLVLTSVVDDFVLVRSFFCFIFLLHIIITGTRVTTRTKATKVNTSTVR